MKWRTIIGLVVVAVVCVVGGMYIGAWLKGGDSNAGDTVATATQSPASSVSATPNLPTKNPATDPTTNPASEPVTTAPTTRSPVLPTPATGSLTQGRKKVLLGGKLTIPNTPAAWEETSSDGDSSKFKDVSNCSASCPTIWVYDVTKGQNHVTFGDNPLAAWATDHCHGQGTDSKVEFTAGGGQPATYRHLSCEGQDFFAWYVPGKKVLVTTQDADGRISDPNIVQAVLESIVWNR